MGGLNGHSRNLLPTGWEWVKLKDVCTITSGKRQDKVQDEKGQYPIYGSSGIFGYANEYLCKEGSTIVGRKGTINNPIFAKTKFWNVDTAFGIKPSKRLDDKLFYYFCKGFNFHNLDKSTTIPSLAKTDLLEIDIPLPPIDEQRQIVSKIEELFSELDKSIEQLKTAQQQLKVYRQSVLKCAFESIVDKQDKSVEDCCTHVVDCLHSTAKFKSSGYYCVDTTCIVDGRILLDRIRYVDGATFRERISRLKPIEGDILFAREGTVGTTLIVPRGIELCLGQRMMMFRLKSSILSKYLMYYFLSPLFKSQYQGLIGGTTSPHLNIRDIKKFNVVTTKTEGQERVVEEIESRLSVADKLEETIANSLQQAEALRQSILKKAFEGRL